MFDKETQELLDRALTLIPEPATQLERLVIAIVQREGVQILTQESIVGRALLLRDEIRRREKQF